MKPRKQEGTETSRGFIPHVPVYAPGIGTFFAPVKLAVHNPMRRNGITKNDLLAILMTERKHRDVPVPMSRDGMYVYALPGGGEVLA